MKGISELYTFTMNRNIHTVVSLYILYKKKYELGLSSNLG